MYKLSQRSLLRIAGIDDELLELVQRSIAKSPIDFGIPEFGGYRTAKEQNELFKKDVSKCDGIKVLSKHQSGNAFDVYAYINGRASWDPVHLAIIAGVILSEAKVMNLKIRWGGTFGSNNFKGWDSGHYELIN